MRTLLRPDSFLGVMLVLLLLAGCGLTPGRSAGGAGVEFSDPKDPAPASLRDNGQLDSGAAPVFNQAGSVLAPLIEQSPDEQKPVLQKAQTQLNDWSQAYQALAAFQPAQANAVDTRFTDLETGALSLADQLDAAYAAADATYRAPLQYLAGLFRNLGRSHNVYRVRGPRGDYAFTRSLADTAQFMAEHQYVSFQGVAFRAYNSASLLSTRGVYRCYVSPPADTYFVARDAKCEGLTGNAPVLLGHVTTAPNAFGGSALIRLRQVTPRENHLVTVNPEERDWLVRHGWREEAGFLGYAAW